MTDSSWGLASSLVFARVLVVNGRQLGGFAASANHNCNQHWGQWQRWIVKGLIAWFPFKPRFF